MSTLPRSVDQAVPASNASSGAEDQTRQSYRTSMGDDDGSNRRQQRHHDKAESGYKKRSVEDHLVSFAETSLCAAHHDAANGVTGPKRTDHAEVAGAQVATMFVECDNRAC